MGTTEAPLAGEEQYLLAQEHLRLEQLTDPICESVMVSTF